MPGRGQYWKKGGLVDETVKEEDLSQALQTKVNAVGGGGSGNWELVGDVTVSGGPIGEQNVNLSRTVNLDGTDVSMVVAVINTRLTSNTGIAYRYNNVTTGGYSCSGNDLGGIVYNNFNEVGSQIVTDKGYTSSGVFSILELTGNAGPSGNQLHGHIREAGNGQTVGAIGKFTINTNFTTLTSFQLKTEGGSSLIADGTTIRVYAITLN